MFGQELLLKSELFARDLNHFEVFLVETLLSDELKVVTSVDKAVEISVEGSRTGLSISAGGDKERGQLTGHIPGFPAKAAVFHGHRRQLGGHAGASTSSVRCARLPRRGPQAQHSPVSSCSLIRAPNPLISCDAYTIEAVCSAPSLRSSSACCQKSFHLFRSLAACFALRDQLLTVRL